MSDLNLAQRTTEVQVNQTASLLAPYLVANSSYFVMDTLPTQLADNNINLWEQDPQLVNANIHRDALPLLEKLSAVKHLPENLIFQGI